MAAADERPPTVRLAAAGFVAAAEEATELTESAAGDAALLERLVARRLTGEPLAWITGRARFCDVELRVHPGVYVPRWHSEALARLARERLPDAGVAIDLCTGSGAIACVLSDGRPGARIVATDADPRAVACARDNGVDALLGDLFGPVPATFAGAADVVVGVVPYVPAGDFGLLQRDTLTFESALPYDGGPDGTSVLRRVIAGSPRFLRPGGSLLLELGRGQPEALATDLDRHGFTGVSVLTDEEGDVRGIEARFEPGPAAAA